MPPKPQGKPGDKKPGGA